MDVLCLKKEKTAFWKELEKETSIKGLTKKSIYNPFLIFKIIPFLRQYDLIHLHLFPALYWTVLAKWISFSKTKIIFTEHSPSNNRRKNILFHFFDYLMYKQLNKIVTISDDVDNKIKNYLKIKKTKFELIYNGINLSHFIKVKPYPKTIFFPENSFILIQVSSFRIQKDQKTLIKSLQHLPEEIVLLLVGDGSLRKEHEELTRKLNLTHRVQFLGLRNDVPQLMKTADVAVLSSHYEGFGLAIVEGMAAKKPVIASNVSGLQEIVSDSGLLFKQGDDTELAEKILYLYSRPEQYKEIAEKCFKRAQDFSIEKMVENYIILYQNILSKK